MGKYGDWKMMLCGLLLWVAGPEIVSAQRIWSDIQLDRTTAYVGQPVEVRITVYTSTWFTKGLDLGNIKVNGAFSVYFRPVSQSFKYEGKTYAGVQQIYHVFPYRAEDMLFPSLDITVESPPEGDYRGVSRTIRSAEKVIKVMPPPPNFDSDQWLVATGLQVSDNWGGNRREVKVGDVLERRISRSASGTVAELIPPIEWDSLAGVSLYAARSSVQNNKTRTAISASRTENMRYLFEKEGEVVLPEMVFTWYNPYRKQLYKRTLPQVTLEVQPNPDLGILASVRDSLNAMLAEEVAPETEDAPITILGLSLRDFFLVLLASVLLAYWLFRLIRWGLRTVRRRRESYLSSELFFFRMFKSAARKQDLSGTLRSLYRWLDELNLAEPSARYFAATYGSPALMEAIEDFERETASGKGSISVDLRLWEAARRNYLSKGEGLGKGVAQGFKWINP